MTSPIDKNTPQYLAKLAHIQLSEGESDALKKDLAEILEYVSKLKGVDTQDTPPMNGGTLQRNIFRDDELQKNTHKGEGVDAFPDTQDGYLKVPPIFG